MISVFNSNLKYSKQLNTVQIYFILFKMLLKHWQKYKLYLKDAQYILVNIGRN